MRRDFSVAQRFQVQFFRIDTSAQVGSRMHGKIMAATRKRVRGAAASSSGLIKLSGGDACTAGLWEQRQQQLFCDANLTAGGTEFHAHRCVLALGSPYFKALFTTSMDASCTLEMAASTFEAVLAWLYSGACSVPESAVVLLLEAAIFLQVMSLRDALVSAVTERLSSDSCVGAWVLGARYEIPALVTAARKVCLQEFESLSDFSALSAEQFGELLDCDELKVAHEHVAFDALTRWLAAQATAPSEDVFAALVRKIRFGVVDEAARARVADAPEMQSLSLMKILAKSSAGSTPRRKIVPSQRGILAGVQHNLHDSLLDGWKKHYDAPYKDKTKLSDLSFKCLPRPTGSLSVRATRRA